MSHQQYYSNHQYETDHYNYNQNEHQQPQPTVVDRYASYLPSDHYQTNYPPPPHDLSNPDYSYDPTYPPDHYYHPDHAYHPDYHSEYNQQPPYGLDEKYPPPSELYPPQTATPTKPFHNSSSASINAPSRGSVAAQLAAEGAIPEKAGLRMWRHDERSGAFTRGGKSKSCGRCCCCTFVAIVIIIVGIIAAFLLWVRPPNATFNGIAPPTAGNQVDLQPNGFLLNFDLDIGVTNPNFFGASFSKISAKAYYTVSKTASIGGGELEHVDIKPHSNTTINFPFQINYTTSMDPNREILADIANKCGFLGAAKSPIKISFDITLRLKVLAISLSPTFSSSNTFSCPLKQSDFKSVLGGSQSIDALSNMLTGSSGSSNNATSKRARRSLDKRFSSQYEDDDTLHSEIDDDPLQSEIDEDREVELLLQKVLNQPPLSNSPSQLKFVNVQSHPSSPLTYLTPSNLLSSFQQSLANLLSSFHSRFLSLFPSTFLFA